MDIKCPITQEIMYDPVIASDGVIYERDAINKWLSIHKHSPVKGPNESLNITFYECSAIKRYIDNYLTDNPKKKEKQYSPSLEYKDNVNQIIKFIGSHQFDKLLMYKNYDALDMSNHRYNCIEIILSHCKQLDTIKHFIENCKDIEKYRYTSIGSAEKQKRTILHLACANPDLDLVKYLVENKNMSLESISSTNERPIHIACRCIHNKEIVEYLISKGVDLECETASCQRPIHYALNNNNIEIIKLLIKHKVDLKSKDDDKNTLVHYAAKHSNLDTFKFLIDTIGTIDTIECENINGERPIHIACKNNKNDIIKYLAPNVDMEAVDLDGCRPIHRICQTTNLEMLQYLCELDVDLNCETAFKNRPMHFVCGHSKTSGIDLGMIKCIIESAKSKGVILDIDAKNVHDKKPIDYALSTNFECAKYLIENGAKLSDRSIYYMIRSNENKSLEFFQYVVKNIQGKIDFEYKIKSLIFTLFSNCDLGLIKYISSIKMEQDSIGFDFEIENNEWNRPIHYVINTEKIKYLVEQHVSLDCENSKYIRPIDQILNNRWYDVLVHASEHGYDLKPYEKKITKVIIDAVKSGDLESLKILSKISKIYPNINNIIMSNRHMIHLACEFDQLNIVKFLVENGADPELTSQNGSRPIHFACQKASVELIDYLVSDLGVDLESDGEGRRKPIHWATIYNKADVIKYIVGKNVSLTEVGKICHNTRIEKPVVMIKNNQNLSNKDKKKLYKYMIDKENSAIFDKYYL